MRSNFLKRLFLSVFSRFNPGDITISHHFTGDRLHLHSFYHRSYWFQGKRRESETMRMFAGIILPGGCVLDVGGHIGYVSMYFAWLVGREGQVFVFEPAPNNLKYLRKNVESISQIRLIPKGVGKANGQQKMYVESLTGQNCSFVQEYVIRRNAERSYMTGPSVYEVDVEIITLDDFAQNAGIQPDFVKIDVEGFELEVLQGATWLLNEVKPMLMVEMRRNLEAVLACLTKSGYRLFTPQLEQVESALQCGGNVFCLHEKAHSRYIRELMQSDA